MLAFDSDPSGKQVSVELLLCNLIYLFLLFFFKLFFNRTQCVESSGANWTEVSACIAGEAGKKLQLKAETDTQTIGKPWPKNIPTIVYNNVSALGVSQSRIFYYKLILLINVYFLFSLQKFEQEKQDRSLNDFKAVVCDSLPNPNPGLCAK